MLEIRMISSNPHKIAETQAILGMAGVSVVPLQLKIEELQTTDIERLVRDKALKAFQRVGRPLFVEHTGLYLSSMGGLPGGLTQIFWDTLEADRFAALFGTVHDTSVIARTTIAYVDGKRFHLFTGEIQGNIAAQPRGPRDFQWDCVFVPSGSTETFAEMGPRKNDDSMRRRALDAFAIGLQAAGGP